MVTGPKFVHSDDKGKKKGGRNAGVPGEGVSRF